MLTTCFYGCNNEETQSEEYDFEDMVADFVKLLFLASVSSCVSSPDALCSLGPTDEDIEMAGKSPAIAVIAGETAAAKSSKQYAARTLMLLLLLVCLAKDTLFLRPFMMYNISKYLQVR